MTMNTYPGSTFRLRLIPRANTPRGPTEMVAAHLLRTPPLPAKPCISLRLAGKVILSSQRVVVGSLQWSLPGVFVMFGAVFAGVLVQPPYNFEYEYIGLVFAGQIVVSMMVGPAQGYLSDWLVKFIGKRDDGLVEVRKRLLSLYHLYLSSFDNQIGGKPETRLIPLILPFIVSIVSTIIFGRASQSPQNWHWSAIVVSFNVEFYGFVSVFVASFTYVIDSYPSRSDAALVVLCFARGVISFALSWEWGVPNTL